MADKLSTILSRREAMALGVRRYFTGKPCKRGHVAQRDIHGGCLECKSERDREYRAAAPEKVRERERESARKRRAADPEKMRENWRRWRARNPRR